MCRYKHLGFQNKTFRAHWLIAFLKFDLHEYSGEYGESYYDNFKFDLPKNLNRSLMFATTTAIALYLYHYFTTTTTTNWDLLFNETIVRKLRNDSSLQIFLLSLLNDRTRYNSSCCFQYFKIKRKLKFSFIWR